jgi:hypothetical protein
MRPVRRSIACAAAVAALFALPAAAQVSLTPRALGMGGAYVAAARGQESLFQNPANLGLPGSPHWSSGVGTLVAGATVRGLSVGEFAELVQYNDRSESERADLLAAIPAEGTGADVEVRAPLFALQMRRFAVGVGYGVVGNHTVNRSVADLVLNGYQPGRTYSIENTAGFRASYWDFALAYGNRVGPVALGATARYVLAGDLVRSGLVDVDTVFAGPLPTDLEVTYAGVRSSGGGGFGLDVGAAMQPIPGLTLGASIENLLNTVEWDGDVELRTVTLDADDYENGDPQEILNRYKQSDRPYDEAAADPRTRALAAQLGADRGAGLPALLRLGAAYSTGTGTTVAAAYHEQLQTSAFSGLWTRQASLGIQQRIPLVTLRAGVASDFGEGSMLSGGLSLGPLQLGVARVTRGADGDRREGWIATVGLAGRSDSTMP